MASRPRQSKANVTPALRAKVWVDLDGKLGLSEAGADLLEQIEASGSLSEAARRLRFAYRRAWLLVNAMNKAWPEPLVTTAAGGKRGGGTVITPYGRHILSTYRDIQLQMEHLLGTLRNPFDAAP